MDAQTTPASTDDVVFNFLGWLHNNRKPLIIVVVIAAVVGIGAGLYSWKQGENQAEANAKLLALPISQDLRLHPSDGALAAIASDYPSTPAGEFASLLQGENLFVSGDFAKAQQAFAKFQSDYPGSSLLPQASMGVAASLEAQGKLSEATQQYERVIQANGTDASIVEPAKLTLGQLQEAQKRFDLAFMQYKDLAQSPNQNDPWATEARQRLQLLVGDHPELLKSVTAPAVGTGNATAVPVSRPPGAPTLSASPAAKSSGTLSASPAAKSPSAGSNGAPHFEFHAPANSAPPKH